MYQRIERGDVNFNLGTNAVKVSEIIYFFNLAYENYHRAIILDPSYVPTYRSLAKLQYTNVKSHGTIIETFEKTFKYDERYARAYNDLGEFYLNNGYYKKGYYNKALENFEKAIDIRPDFKRAYENKCKSLKKLKGKVEAYKCQQKAKNMKEREILRMDLVTH